ncbi:5-(carboxyamino)imidazole ribonucleotide synthase [Chengkuizengella axinellae]|uniref:N5-carboxyaminoimidazole ribonucleotide synthase n=1 Tax=Chengkuizengella axinellae TaxID=3064388 RepID=A0ABT9J7W0_9BACL|nr:5-(carboxyamino)imidazole ribonucleotide synthase [Chengkuizengella sp. 2205SS18-9]MDP5277080.1 5-(carboxyamino)imidazole ribonucleotide synthase [Chengkuizengella sp. 2205SS18-9]
MKQRQVILPGSTIGILGGGQLGRMMTLAGRQMGYRFITLDPVEDAPCAQVADEQIVAGYDDYQAAEKLAERADVITYEFENVNASVADMLSEKSYVPQGSQLLYTTQHRLREKRAIEDASVPVAPYAEIKSEQDLVDAVQRFGTPCVLKTAVGGYDGKGQWVIRSTEEISDAYNTLRKANTDLVLEQFIRFEKELSVVAARNKEGQVSTFPVAENIHIDNILHTTIVPARIDQKVQDRAKKLAKNIAETLDVVGLIAVEMFYTSDGKLYVNELAPRPHNSGHYTMDACKTSQFEQHIRAICNLPLESSELICPVVMVNILGEHVDPLLKWMEENHQNANQDVIIKVHLYGKKEAKEKRKMGHINLLTKDINLALDWIENTGIWEKKQLGKKEGVLS